ECRAWAPSASSLAVRANGEEHELAEAGDGVFEGTVPASPRDDYVYLLDGERELPDPYSRYQPRGVRGPSRVVDTSAFRIADGPELRLEELVLYELHVGTFSE